MFKISNQLIAGFILIAGSSAAIAQIPCDGKSYDELRSEQFNSDNRFIGTAYDECYNFKSMPQGKIPYNYNNGTYYPPNDVEYVAGSSPTSQAVANVSGDDYVEVIEEFQYVDGQRVTWFRFTPQGVDASEVTNAMIFVPGGNADSASYAPLAYNAVRYLTEIYGVPSAAFITRYPERNYRSHISNGKTIASCNVMNNDPGGMTIEAIHNTYHRNSDNPDDTERTRTDEDSASYLIQNWVLGGHSEGGVGASTWLLKLEAEGRVQLGGIKGISFLATSPIAPLQGRPPDNFCSLSIAGGDDLVLAKDQYEAAKRLFFPEKTVYYDWDTGFSNGIHSYMGSYCGLTSDPGVAEGTDEATAELRYYEVAPDSSQPLEISRSAQNAIVYGNGQPGNAGLVLNFMQQAFTGATTNDGDPKCQQPLTDVSTQR